MKVPSVKEVPLEENPGIACRRTANPTLILGACLKDHVGRIVLLTTPDMVRRGVPENLKGALRSLDLPELALIEVDPFSPASLADGLARGLGGISGTELAGSDGGGRDAIVDVTGGTKIMSIGLFNAAFERGLPIVYVDTGSRRIREIGPVASGVNWPAQSPPLSIRAVLAIHGRPAVEAQDGPPEPGTGSLPGQRKHHLAGLASLQGIQKLVQRRPGHHNPQTENLGVQRIADEAF